MRRGSVFIMLIVAIALVCLAAPAAQAVTMPQPSKAWTVMVYIDGDNNLEDYVVKDIETELSALGSNANVNVVALADRGPGYDTSRGDWQTTKVYYCTQGMLADAASAVADWGERDMGDPQTLRDFVTWTKANFPATKYLLAFWDHGYMTFQGYTSVDDTSGGDALNEDEQVAAMTAVGPVSVVAWDMCNRQMLEVGADWQPFATAMAGSESYTNWEGIQYDAVISAIRATPAMTPQQVSDKVAATALGDSDTFSSVALDARFTTLTTAVDQWAVALQAGLPVYKSAYLSARRSTVSYYSVALRPLAARLQHEGQGGRRDDQGPLRRRDERRGRLHHVQLDEHQQAVQQEQGAHGLDAVHAAAADALQRDRLHLLPDAAPQHADPLGRVPGGALPVTR